MAGAAHHHITARVDHHELPGLVVVQRVGNVGGVHFHADPARARLVPISQGEQIQTCGRAAAIGEPDALGHDRRVDIEETQASENVVGHWQFERDTRAQVNELHLSLPGNLQQVDPMLAQEIECPL
ncbi:hypothetical protein D3C80_1076410 [compost metagenome]